jgi:hypothetical protein
MLEAAVGGATRMRVTGFVGGLFALCAACSSSTGGNGAGGGSTTGGHGAGGAPISLQCGSETCKAGQVCEAFSNGAGPGGAGPSGPSYSCVPIPAACEASPNCDCVAAAVCGGVSAEGCMCGSNGCQVYCSGV